MNPLAFDLLLIVRNSHCVLYICSPICVFVPNSCSESVSESSVTSGNRQGRQQGQSGDTYTLEIAFPAVKYVGIDEKERFLVLGTTLVHN